MTYQFAAYHTDSSLDPNFRVSGRTDLVFNRDATRLAASGEYGAPSVVVWDVTSGRKLFTLPERVDSGEQVFGPPSIHGRVSGSALTPDGRTVVVWVESSGEVSGFDVDTGTRLYRLPAARGLLESLTTGPDERVVFAGTTDNQVRTLDARTGRPAGPPLRHPVNPGPALAISPDGRFAATVATDKRLRVWDVRTGDLLDERPVHDIPTQAWFDAHAENVILDFRGDAVRVPLLRYAGPAGALPLATRVLTGRMFDDAGALTDLPPDEFIRRRAEYRKAWLDWRGLPDDPAAQP